VFGNSKKLHFAKEGEELWREDRRERGAERRCEGGLFERQKKYTLQRKVKRSGGKREASGERSGARSGAAMRETVFLKLEKITLCKGR
jgi:hypothetical protein